MVFVVMGVVGSGKTTVGRALAAALHCPFHDADDLHTLEHRAQMARGEALTDEQRLPWLRRVREVIERAATAGEDAVVACSALRDDYRQILANGLPRVMFIFLAASRDLVRVRVSGRADHYAGLSLVDSQFAALEVPADALTLDASLPVERLVNQVLDMTQRGVTEE